MKKYTQWPILAMAFIMLLVLTTACDFPGVASTPAPKPPLTLLQDSQKKMSAVHSLALSGDYTRK
jgi:hypothetical protein